MPREARLRFDERERMKAVADARELIESDGYSQTKACETIAEDLGLSSPRTIGMWAVDLGAPLPAGSVARAAARKMNEASIVYNQLARCDLSDRFFRRIATLLEHCHEPADMQKLAIAFAVITEKRRLEEGKSTGRTSFELPQNGEPQSLEELATGTTRQPLPGNVSPLARRSFSPVAQ